MICVPEFPEKPVVVGTQCYCHDNMTHLVRNYATIKTNVRLCRNVAENSDPCGCPLLLEVFNWKNFRGHIYICHVCICTLHKGQA